MKKTQCPNCFTVYRISEQQIAQSRGKVRCGHCHAQFKAELLEDHELVNVRKKREKADDLFASQEESLGPALAENPRNDLNLESKTQKSGRAEPKMAEATGEDQALKLPEEKPSLDNSVTKLASKKAAVEPTLSASPFSVDKDTPPWELVETDEKSLNASEAPQSGEKRDPVISDIADETI